MIIYYLYEVQHFVQSISEMVSSRESPEGYWENGVWTLNEALVN